MASIGPAASKSHFQADDPLFVLRHLRKSHKFLPGLAVALIGLASIFLVGWYFGLTALTKVSENFAPVQWSTAIALMWVGIGLWAMTAKNTMWQYIVALTAYLEISIGFTAIADFFFPRAFWLDWLSVNFPLVQSILVRVNTSPNSGIAFICMGVFSLIELLPSRPHIVRWISLLASIATFLVGLTALYGFTAEIEPGYHWGDFTQMPPQMSLIFIVVGLMTLAYRLTDGTERNPRTLINQTGIVVSLLVFGSTICEWNAIRLDKMAAELGALATGRVDRAFSNLATLLAILGVIASALAYFVTTFLLTAIRREAELKLAKQHAESVSQHKTEFLADMSHEIRTPLNAISGFAELMALNREDAAQRGISIAGIMRNSKILIQLIENILDLSKIEAGKLSIEKTDVVIADLLDDIESTMTPNAKRQGIELRCAIKGKIPNIIVGDPMRLRQILTNIVGNAVKFTEKGFVEITLSADEREMAIAVRDTGIGLTLEQQAGLFQKFNQAEDSTTRRFGGSGLGLELSLRIAHAMGGSLTIAESQPGQGTTFKLQFPYDKTDRTEWINSLPNSKSVAYQTFTQGEAENLTGRKILVVDDAPDNRFITLSYLTYWNASVSEARNGMEALQMLKQKQFDLIIMDLQMPIMDGATAITAIRKEGITTPAIALSANALKEEAERCRNLGFNAYLSKPVDQFNLARTVSQYLPKNSSQLKMTRLDEIQKMALPVFLSSMKERLQRLHKACQTSDLAEVNLVAHQIAGTAGSFGFPELGDVARAIEQSSLSQENFSEVIILVDKLAHQFSKISGC